MNDEGDGKREEQPVGQRLREIREQRQLSLQQVEQAIKIHAHHLEALEKGDHAALPNLAWGRGFLILYGNYLGLDGEQLAGQLFPLQRTFEPKRYLRRRWRSIIAVGGAIALAAVILGAIIGFPFNSITERLADLLARVAPSVFLSSNPQRIVVFGYAESDMEGADHILVAEVAEEGLGLLSIPTDTPVQLPDHKQGDIGDVLAMGRPDLTRKTVSSLMAKEVQHYVVLSTYGIKRIVHSMGGVTIDVDRPVSGRTSSNGSVITLKPGLQKLDGDQALVYMQGSDLHNSAEIAKRQETFLYAMLRQALGPSNLLANPGTVVLVSENIETNMGTIQMLQLVGRVLELKDTGGTLKMKDVHDH